MFLKPKHIGSLLPTDILFQTSYWGEVKQQTGCSVQAFDIAAGNPAGDILVLIQSHGPNGAIASVPQGPEFAPPPENYGPFLEELTEALRGYLDPSVVCIRYDLPWESQYAAEMRQFQWQAYPEARLREMRMNFGTRFWNLRKAQVDMTVASSLVVDLSGSEEELLGRMKPKTRYNIRLAERRGVTVLQASRHHLRAFYTLYCQTATRNGFVSCDYRHFRAMFDALVHQSSHSEILFLLATRHSDLLAGAIIAICGKRATYLYGASANTLRNLMGPYALHWAAMQQARRQNCLFYDMGAVSPGLDPEHPFHGLYRFKTGFGGTIELRSGSWDYPLQEDAYRAFRHAEMLACGRTAAAF